ncbi:MAG: ABC transporter substrate-binding protein [Oscillospiraceae bacterium]|jgi:peptide/nickel transport system substrate-binding protein
MTKMKKRLAFILSIAMLVGLFAGCGPKASENSPEPTGEAPASTPGEASTPIPTTEAQVVEASGKTDKTLTVGTTDPCLYFYTSGSVEASNYSRRLVYDQLFEMDDNTGEVTSRILSSWEWVDDVTLKVVLKDNVTFSDGTKMTGEDILFTLQNYVTNGNAEAENFKKIDYAKSYVEADGLTAYIIYSNVYGAAMSTLMIPINSKAFCEAHPDGDSIWWTDPVGSGPYKVAEIETDSYVLFERREDYWDSKAVFPPKAIRLNFYKDPTTMLADFQNGVIDVMLKMDATQVDQINSGAIEGAKVVVQSANDVVMLTFNQNVPVLADPRVREAIAYAVDWEAVGIAGRGSLAMKATSHYPTTFPAYTEHSYPFDPEKAKQILAEAGYSEGDIEINLVCVPFDAQDIMGEAIQAYLAEIGIILNVNVYDIPTFIPMLINGEGDSSMQSTGGAGGNPAHEPNTSLSTMVLTGFKIQAIPDQQFNDLMNAGLATTDPDKRTEIYKQVDQWLYDKFQAIPIYEALEAYAYGPKIASFKVASVNRGCLANVQFK